LNWPEMTYVYSIIHASFMFLRKNPEYDHQALRKVY